MNGLAEHLMEAMKQATGYLYPNEVELHWGILVVVYPYVTGLVAGAFILASLEKVFNVKELQPTYRLSLLSALSFLIVAPIPLLAHLGHPERSFEIFLTPHTESAMAMFGFVYAWYLAVVLLLELWFDYRKDLVVWSLTGKGWSRWFYKVLTLGSNSLSEKSLKFDKKACKFITIIGIPSAFLLHGYVGFIFGSVKANPWWSSVLMPVVFLFSAIVSGIALMLVLYVVTTLIRRKKIDMRCLDKLASFLLYAIIIDFSLEMLDFIHRLYESEESITILSELISSRLFLSLIIMQISIGTLLPMISLAVLKLRHFSGGLRKIVYTMSAFLALIGIFSTRWNVVIGGQLFSKSLRGLTTYKMQLLGIEGFLVSAALLILPLVILAIFVRIAPPWPDTEVRLEPEQSKGWGGQ